MLIKDRQDNSDRPLMGCLANRCCEWSSQFKKTFGEDFQLKANINLFLERIAKSMPIDSDNRSRCLKGLEFVFRQENDREPIRMLETADPLTIQKQLDDFLLEWKDLKNHTGSHVIPPTALKEIYSLEKHIVNGCLSYILPLGNDLPVHSILETHQTLQKWVANARIGIPLAMSLFSMGFHELNKERGLASSEIESESKSLSNSLTSTRILNLTEITETVERYILENSVKVMESDDGDLFPVQNVTTIAQLKRFLMYIKCHQSICHFVPDIEKLPRLIPYFMSPLHLISAPCFIKNNDLTNGYYKDVNEIQTCINRDIEDINLVEQDNNSIITVVINYLKNYHELHVSNERTKEYYQFLSLQGMDFSQNCDELIALLTGMIQSKMKDMEIANTETMLSILSDFFHVVIFLITSFKRFPILPIYPVDWNLNSPNIFIILRDQLYLPVLLDLNTTQTAVSKMSNISMDIPVDSQLKNFRCRCGRGKSDKNQIPQRCVTLEGQRYPSRCLCFRAGEACASICDCRSCNNPHGMRIMKAQFSDTNSGRRTRKRHAHDGQNLFKDILSRITSRKPVKPSSNRSWNAIECLLFELTLSETSQQSSESINLTPWSYKINIISEKYNEYVDTMRLIPGLTLRKKLAVEVEKKLEEREDDILGCSGMFGCIN